MMRFPAVFSQNETGIARGSTRRRPSLASPYNRLARRFAQRIGASRFGLSGLLLIAAWWDGEGSPESGPEVPSVAPFPAWIDIRDASEVFRLDAPEMAGETRSYKALRHPSGGGRQDILEFSG
jgi:hypothetical protein